MVPYDYAIVQLPIGTIVAALPVGYETVVVGPSTYYFYNGTYYVAIPGGYVVVNAPAELA